MNNDRRKRITAIVSQLETLRDELDTLTTEEQYAFDNMPESIQNADRGNDSQTAIDTLQSAHADVDNAVSGLQDIL